MRDQARIDALRVELIAKNKTLASIAIHAPAHGDLFETGGWGIERRIIRISEELRELQLAPEAVPLAEMARGVPATALEHDPKLTQGAGCG